MKQQTVIFVTAPFPAYLEKQARIEAAKQGVSRAQLVRLAVVEFLKKLEAQPAPASPQEAINARPQ
jgi:hypothetical protein